MCADPVVRQNTSALQVMRVNERIAGKQLIVRVIARPFEAPCRGIVVETIVIPQEQI